MLFGSHGVVLGAFEPEGLGGKHAEVHPSPSYFSGIRIFQVELYGPGLMPCTNLRLLCVNKIARSLWDGAALFAQFWCFICGGEEVVDVLCTV